jgi:hypothetical protein
MPIFPRNVRTCGIFSPKNTDGMFLGTCFKPEDVEMVCLRNVFIPEDEESVLLRNAGSYLGVFMALIPKRT